MVSVLRRLKISATTNNIKIAGKVAIKTINHKLEKILSFSNSACCFSNNNSCSLACAFVNNACCNLIISSICSLISFPLATSFCIVPNWLLNKASRWRKFSFSFKIACKPSIESKTSFCIFSKRFCCS